MITTKKRRDVVAITLMFVACVLAPFVNRLNAQQIEWKNYSDETFVYEISNDEAKRLYSSHSNDSVMLDMLHSPVTSFRGNWEHSPNKGHFIFVNFFKDKAYYNYVPILPFQVFLFNEYDRLTLQVVDSLGDVRDDAKVNIKMTDSKSEIKLPFDKKTRTYGIRDDAEASKEKEWLLVVELDGFATLFDLSREGYRTINKKSERAAAKKRARFQEKEFYSYLITDKQKYKPGEAVRFKSYALSEQRKPMRETLDLFVNDKKTGTVKPYRPGGYTGELMLHDSLELKLDRNYNLRLMNGKGRVVASTNFTYEDYVLINGRVEAGVLNKIHYSPDTNRLELSAWDVNGLRLQNVSADICVKRRSVSASFTDVLILPDTLLLSTISLDNADPTLFDLPASLFGASNCLYDVFVQVYTDDNQVFKQSVYGIPFYASQQKIRSFLQNDSICFEFEELGKVKPAKAQLRYDKQESAKEIVLPYKEPFHQTIKQYGIQMDNPKLIHYSHVGDLKSGMRIEGSFSCDSLHVRLVNPHRLDATCFVYEGNRLIHKGYGKELDFFFPGILFDKVYVAEVFYTLGNKQHQIRKSFMPRKEMLHVDIDLPERVFPGQTTDAVITVSDYRGLPAENVDITAFSVNSRIGTRINDVPYYGVWPQARDYQYNYRMKAYETSDWTTPIDYAFWSKKAKLDTLTYYDFMYPKGRLFRFEQMAPDGVTQFAPFVVKDGRLVQIFDIRLDEAPVGYAWLHASDCYSFIVSDEKPTHSVALRLHDRTIVLNNLKLGSGKKTILSIDMDALPTVNVTVVPEEPMAEGLIFLDNYDLSRLNDFVRSATGEAQSSDRCGSVFDVWTPSAIAIRDDSLHLMFRLPKYEESVGVAYLLLRNRQTNTLIIPSEMTQLMPKYPEIPESVYDAILLYNDGRYVRFDSIPIRPYCYIEVKMSDLPVQPADHRSADWLLLKEKIMNYDYYVWDVAEKKRKAIPDDSPFKRNRASRAFSQTQIVDEGFEGMVCGVVRDPEGDVLPGASVSIVGTNRHTVTNKEGNFEISVNQSDMLMRISYLGYLSQTVMVRSGSFIDIVMEEDPTPLEQVTVVAFGKQKKQSFVGSTSVLVKSEEYYPEEKDLMTERAGRSPDEAQSSDSDVASLAEEQLYNELLHLSSLRSDFRDVAFWEPQLVTDQSGKVDFKVTFPDDITSWNTVVYAMNETLQTGMGRKNIRSYKPLMAELKTPSFLVRGDRSDYVGSVRNQTVGKQTIHGGVLFAVGADTVTRKNITFDTSHQDKLQVSPTTTDSLTTTYLFRRDDGFTDGERRTIPVVEQGAELALSGMTEVLERGARRTITAAADERVEISLYAEQLDVYLDELAALCVYPYDCNEQLASKLIGMLHYKSYCKQAGTTFTHERNVRKIINRLLDNRNEQGRWAWWGNAAEASSWMSAHVVRALKAAAEAGYEVAFDFKKAEKEMLQKIHSQKVTLHDIELANALSASGVVGDYPEVVKIFEALIRAYEKPSKRTAVTARSSTDEVSYLKEKLLLLELCQKNHVTYSVDSVLKYIHEDPSGAMYCDDGTERPWYKDASATTLIAYRIVRDNPSLQHLVAPMQLYILNAKKNGWNTYTASSAIMAILPDLMTRMLTKDKQAKVELFGKTNEVITKFPYKLRLEPGETVTVEKQSGIPLFCSVNRLRYATEARVSDVFDVQTALDSEILTAGKATTLTVTVEVKQRQAEHVMIEVPIPAGCGYAKKRDMNHRQWRKHETYRESFKEKTVIFCERLSKGTYTFEIELLPRYTGYYSLNPAHVSDMYQPLINANNQLRSIQIEERPGD